MFEEKQLKNQLDYQPFHADIELNKIKKLPKALKKSAIQEYKKKLIHQKDGLAEIQTTLLCTLNARPDKPLNKLMATIKKQAPKYLLCFSQIEALERFIKKYQKQHKWVNKYYNAAENYTKLYKKCLGRQPKGKIDILKDNINFYFHCPDFEDYFHFFTFSKHKRKMSPEKEKKECERARRSSGCFIREAAIKELDGALTAGKTESFSPRVFMHETQHALYNILPKERPKRYQSFLRFYNSKTEAEKLTALPAYCRWQRVKMEEIAKDEILAYFIIDDPKMYIEKILCQTEKQGGLYDYYSENKDKIYTRIRKYFSNTSSYKIKRIMDKIFIDEYHQLITEGLEAIVELKRMNYRHEKIMALLTPEPLIQWLKLVKRIWIQKTRQTA